MQLAHRWLCWVPRRRLVGPKSASDAASPRVVQTPTSTDGVDKLGTPVCFTWQPSHLKTRHIDRTQRAEAVPSGPPQCDTRCAAQGGRTAPARPRVQTRFSQQGIRTRATCCTDGEHHWERSTASGWSCPVSRWSAAGVWPPPCRPALRRSPSSVLLAIGPPGPKTSLRPHSFSPLQPLSLL